MEPIRQAEEWRVVVGLDKNLVPFLKNSSLAKSTVEGAMVEVLRYLEGRLEGGNPPFTLGRLHARQVDGSNIDPSRPDLTVRIEVDIAESQGNLVIVKEKVANFTEQPFSLSPHL